MSFKIKTILFATTLSTVGAAAYLLSTDNSQKDTHLQQARELASIEDESSKKISHLSLKYSLEQGQRYTYEFQRKIVFHGFPNGDKAAKFSGTFSIDVLKASEKSFSGIVSERIDGQEPNPVLLYIEVNKDGKKINLRSASWEDEANEQNLSVLKDLTSIYFFPAQQDTVGEYKSEVYEISSPSNWNIFKKIKTAYINTTPNILPKILASRHIIRWPKAWSHPDSLRGEEITRIGHSQQSALTAENIYSMRFLKKEIAATYTDEQLLSLNKKEKFSLTASTQKNPIQQGQNISWKEIRKHLQEISHLPHGKQLELFGDLVRMLSAQPDKLRDLLSLLESEGALAEGNRSALFQAAVGALATVASNEAQSALIELYHNLADDSDSKGTILAALTTTQATLSDSTQSFLTRAMTEEADRNLAYGAAFALGSSLQSSQNTNSIQALLQEWERQKSLASIEGQIAVLDAMGNSGLSDFLPQILEATSASNPEEIRAKAVFSLRFINTTTSQEKKATSLFDQSVNVRSSAVRSIQASNWDDVFLKPLQDCGQKESANDIKANCLALLSQ